MVGVAPINVHAPKNVFKNKMGLLWEGKNGERKCTIEEKKKKIQENKKAHYRRKGKNAKKRICYRREKKPKEKKACCKREK